ncbi:MAG: RpiB/LacA/LacB family sugar-phosphate isomerase [bacterium]
MSRPSDAASLVDGAGYPSGIVANMLPNVYAAVANDPLSARYAREHSDTNVLCLGARIIGAGLAGQIVETWMIAKFLGGKYAARVEKVRRLASKHRRDPGDQTRKVLTVQDMRDAILRRQSMIIDDKTIMTPALLDFVRTVSG